MKIGVVSDSHGNSELLGQAVDWLQRKQKISLLYHLGDEYDDAAGLGDRFLELVQVPGIYDERYKNGSLKAVSLEVVLGYTIALVHCLEKDLSREDAQRSDIILYGHTHREELKLDNGKLYLNPGHLKGPLEKNLPPSFGLLSLSDQNISAVIYGMNFKIIRSLNLMRSESGLYKM